MIVDSIRILISKIMRMNRDIRPGLLTKTKLVGRVGGKYAIGTPAKAKGTPMINSIPVRINAKITDNIILLVLFST
jgi:hypothetical protein